MNAHTFLKLKATKPNRTRMSVAHELEYEIRGVTAAEFCSQHMNTVATELNLHGLYVRHSWNCIEQQLLQLFYKHKNDFISNKTFTFICLHTKIICHCNSGAYLFTHQNNLSRQLSSAGSPVLRLR